MSALFDRKKHARTSNGRGSESRRTAGDGASAKRVVIIGCGFAGLNAAKRLMKEDVEVLVVDRNNYHKFQPLLYQVATAGLEPDEIAHNIRDLFRGHPNVNVRLGTVADIDPDKKVIRFLKGPEEPYDYLIMGVGATTAYFGVEGAQEHAYPLKDLPHAVSLRNHVLRQFERYERDAAEAGPGALNFVVVGGGPTGIETAGALEELFRVMQKDFPTLDTERARVILVEMLPNVLPPYHEASQAYARKVLEDRGVEVRTDTTVERIEPSKILFEGGDELPANTVIWAAGVQANPLVKSLGIETDRAGRGRTTRDLSLHGRPEFFLVGDASGAADASGEAYPQLAPVAMQQGVHAAEQVLAQIEGRPTTPFRYVDRGQMATVGRNAAVAELPGGIRFTGFVAWLLWVFIHVAKLVGFRNRLNVILNWAYNYATFDRSARVIMDMVPISDEMPREVEDVDREIQQTMDEIEAREES
jgi:NADH:ubiquinone reductase (H+-translocating)